MRDSEIRHAVRDRLAKVHRREPDTRYRNELGLCLGETRVDVAAINGAISGYEIKSAVDTLARFPTQVRLYGQVLDFATIVAEGKHAEKVAQLAPNWWGIWQASQTRQGHAKLVELRPAQRNPSPDPLSIAQLLWRDEVLMLLQDLDCAHGYRCATRWVLWERLVEVLELADLQAAVRQQLKARPEWSGG